MALIGNRSVLHKSPGRFLNAGVATFRSNFTKHGMMRNSVQSFGALAAVPSGHLSSSAWMLPQRPNAMTAFTRTNFSWTVSPLALANGINIEGTSTFAFTTPPASLSLIIALEGTSTFSFSVPAAAMSISLGMSGTSTFAFTTSPAALSQIINMAGTSSFGFSTTAGITQLLNLSGSTAGATLTNDSIAAAVDEKLRPRFNALGSLVAAGL